MNLNESIINDTDYRIQFCKTYESLGIRINYTDWSDFDLGNPNYKYKDSEKFEEIETDETCPVCFGESYLVQLECNHYLCPYCLEKLCLEYQEKIESSVLARYGYEKHNVLCPCCRAEIDPKKE